jgi:hypothetical protein
VCGSIEENDVILAYAMINDPQRYAVLSKIANDRRMSEKFSVYLQSLLSNVDHMNILLKKGEKTIYSRFFTEISALLTNIQGRAAAGAAAAPSAASVAAPSTASAAATVHSISAQRSAGARPVVVDCAWPRLSVSPFN